MNWQQFEWQVTSYELRTLMDVIALQRYDVL